MKIVFSLMVFIGLIFADGFSVKSDDILGQLSKAEVFNGFGCTGENISPALSWENIPKGTKSFAITLYDKDAPTGSGWWHWVVFDIPKNITSIAKNAGDITTMIMPKGAVQSITDYGKAGFGGACPPVGDKAHQYLFTVYALDVETLGLNEKVSPAVVGYYLNQHTIQKGSVVAYYRR